MTQYLTPPLIAWTNKDTSGFRNLVHKVIRTKGRSLTTPAVKPPPIGQVKNSRPPSCRNPHSSELKLTVVKALWFFYKAVHPSYCIWWDFHVFREYPNCVSILLYALAVPGRLPFYWTLVL